MVKRDKKATQCCFEEILHKSISSFEENFWSCCPMDWLREASPKHSVGGCGSGRTGETPQPLLHILAKRAGFRAAQPLSAGAGVGSFLHFFSRME
jgi:hypothetical protein